MGHFDEAEEMLCGRKPSSLVWYRVGASRNKHEIAEAFVTGHVDGGIGRHLLKLEPLGRLHHVSAHGPIEPLCFQCGDVVGEHFQKRGGEH